ncbi:MAG TPA: STM4012 family radical SAM protein [Armatimonadota bacterium]|nr:STM4012 family radical SAM protein [Armatimonadota bacterium]
MTRLERMLAGTPYAGYAYAYPHKSAYRTLAPPVPLREAWAAEPRDALFLYLHVPFCEMRCGFCNLFTTANPPEELVARYLDALEREAREVREALGPVRITSLAVGGGTPTYLRPAELHRLFDVATELYGVRPGSLPVSVETSPQTALPERLQVLRERGVTRVSMGVQSLVEAEVAAAGRAQKAEEVEAALERLQEWGFPALNVDLIYGLPGQTNESWLRSLERVLRYSPAELYLYPLYVRPLTGLDRRGARTWDDLRLACYRTGRDLLRSHGYRQVSMRMFQRDDTPAGADEKRRDPVYCCQEDGMIGLGCGARSYTQSLHYSSEFAVERRGVRAILDDYVQRPAGSFGRAEHGVELDAEEQRRRYVIKSLLRVEGLSLEDYRQRFNSPALEDLPELNELPEHGLALIERGRLALTDTGLERTDTLGPWLYSDAVRRRSELAVLR